MDRKTITVSRSLIKALLEATGVAIGCLMTIGPELAPAHQRGAAQVVALLELLSDRLERDLDTGVDDVAPSHRTKA